MNYGQIQKHSLIAQPSRAPILGFGKHNLRVSRPQTA